VAEILEYMRANFKVLHHVRPKLSCDACDRIVQAPAPPRPIYGQSEIYAREGVDLDRSTLAGWVGATSELLSPLVEAVRDHVMSASNLHADDTPVPVLAPSNGKTRTGRLWTYVRDDRPSDDKTAPAAWFAYSPDRKGEYPKQHLKLYKGPLQADAYAGFQHLYEDGTIVEVACWALTRRKFHEIHIAHPSPTTSCWTSWYPIDRARCHPATRSPFISSSSPGSGCLARTKDPPPGNTVMWRGLTRLTDIQLGFVLGTQLVGS
jgi:hypothetical protein